MAVRFAWVFLALVVGCSDVEPDRRATFNLVTKHHNQPFEGVMFCQADTDNCASSDAEGHVSIRVPPDEEIIWTLEKEGYDSILVAGSIPQGGTDTFMDLGGFDIASIAELYASVMSPYPRRGTGEIYIQVVMPDDRSGATLELVGATAKAYYEEGTAAGGDVTWRLDLSATAAKGAGGFVEVTPGEHDVRIGGTASGCIPSVAGAFGWTGADESTVRVPVRAGYVSFVQVLCARTP